MLRNWPSVKIEMTCCSLAETREIICLRVNMYVEKFVYILVQLSPDIMREYYG